MKALVFILLFSLVACGSKNESSPAQVEELPSYACAHKETRTALVSRGFARSLKTIFIYQCANEKTGETCNAQKDDSGAVSSDCPKFNEELL